MWSSVRWPNQPPFAPYPEKGPSLPLDVGLRHVTCSGQTHVARSDSAPASSQGRAFSLSSCVFALTVRSTYPGQPTGARGGWAIDKSCSCCPQTLRRTASQPSPAGMTWPVTIPSTWASPAQMSKLPRQAQAPSTDPNWPLVSRVIIKDCCLVSPS